jgi:hypothetical protein
MNSLYRAIQQHPKSSIRELGKILNKNLFYDDMFCELVLSDKIKPAGFKICSIIKKRTIAWKTN